MASFFIFSGIMQAKKFKNKIIYLTQARIPGEGPIWLIFIKSLPVTNVLRTKDKNKSSCINVYIYTKNSAPASAKKNIPAPTYDV